MKNITAANDVPTTRVKVVRADRDAALESNIQHHINNMAKEGFELIDVKLTAWQVNSTYGMCVATLIFQRPVS